ncbi:MAG: hypothetical protein AAB229_03240 [Candidatus Hydrogenedentota bacterium]
MSATVLLALIGGIGNLALATAIIVYDSSGQTPEEIWRRDHVFDHGPYRLSAGDIDELVGQSKALMIQDAQTNPTYGHPPPGTVWKFRLLQVSSNRVEVSDKEEIRRFLAGKFRVSSEEACVDAELIPSTSTGPEMRSLYFIRDPDGRWQPQFPESGKIDRWKSYYF